MKSTKITLRLLATILLLMFICNCFAVIGYASEFETETTAEEETTDVVELENSEGNFIVDEFSSNSESESYPSGFSKANISK